MAVLRDGYKALHGESETEAFLPAESPTQAGASPREPSGPLSRLPRRSTVSRELIRAPAYHGYAWRREEATRLPVRTLVVKEVAWRTLPAGDLGNEGVQPAGPCRRWRAFGPRGNE